MGIFRRKDRHETAPPVEPEPSDRPPEEPRQPEGASDRDGWGDRLQELEGTCAALEHQLAELEQDTRHLEQDTEERIRRLTAAIAEGIEHVDRSERRVRAVVQRAQQRLRESGFEDAGLEAEAAELRRIDAEGSAAEGMQTVLEDVDDGAEPAFDFRGVPGDVSPANLRELGF